MNLILTLLVLVSISCTLATPEDNINTFLGGDDSQEMPSDAMDNSNDVGLVRRALSDVELLENLLMRKIALQNVQRAQEEGTSFTGDRNRYFNTNTNVKRNYNLDHLARMNFRRAFRASDFNTRHILGGLKKK